MNKLSYEEIIEKLKENNITVNDFAYEEVSGNINDYPEALEAQKVRKEFSTLHFKDYKWGLEKNNKFYNNLPNEYTITKNLVREKLGLNWTEVHQYGGEGQGDHWESVKHFPEHDIYIKVVGYYSSYSGTDFNDWKSACSEVKPKEKQITVYE